MKKKENKVSRNLELIGWYGSLAILLSFALVSVGLINGRSYTFQLLSLTGGISLALLSYAKKAYQPAVLNVVFSLIAFFTILSLILWGK